MRNPAQALSLALCLPAFAAGAGPAAGLQAAGETTVKGKASVGYYPVSTQGKDGLLYWGVQRGEYVGWEIRAPANPRMLCRVPEVAGYMYSKETERAELSFLLLVSFILDLGDQKYWGIEKRIKGLDKAFDSLDLDKGGRCSQRIEKYEKLPFLSTDKKRVKAEEVLIEGLGVLIGSAHPEVQKTALLYASKFADGDVHWEKDMIAVLGTKMQKEQLKLVLAALGRVSKSKDAIDAIAPYWSNQDLDKDVRLAAFDAHGRVAQRASPAVKLSVVDPYLDDLVWTGCSEKMPGTGGDAQIGEAAFVAGRKYGLDLYKKAVYRTCPPDTKKLAKADGDEE